MFRVWIAQQAVLATSVESTVEGMLASATRAWAGRQVFRAFTFTIGGDMRQYLSPPDFLSTVRAVGWLS